ncbi:E3 ubiquitin-protein ligase RING1-like-like protein [Drosera capensis]
MYDKPGFLKKLALKFKDPESTTLYILDNKECMVSRRRHFDCREFYAEISLKRDIAVTPDFFCFDVQVHEVELYDHYPSSGRQSSSTHVEASRFLHVTHKEVLKNRFDTDCDKALTTIQKLLRSWGFGQCCVEPILSRFHQFCLDNNISRDRKGYGNGVFFTINIDRVTRKWSGLKDSRKVPSYLVRMANMSHNEPCAICFEGFMDGDDLQGLQCCHVFHENCILKWFQLHHTCPVCRCTIDKKPLELAWYSYD